MPSATPAEKKSLSHRETMLVVFGVLLPVFMGAIDQTILASALPTIGADLGDVHSLPWLITAYLIASTAITPLYGKISDIHGRRFTIIIAIVTYMVGSLICLAAPNMLVLILGRIVHGLGGGGLSAMGMIILGDITEPKDRGRYYAYFSATYMTAGALGPALGGFAAQALHWKVIFVGNIVMGIVALVLSATLLRHLPRRERHHRLDILGAALIMVASVSFMLALNLGGVRLPWTSPAILALGAAALLIGALFVVRLLTAPEPLIPLAILTDPVARLAIGLNAFGWGAILGLNIFLPMYLQSVIGLSPTNAGLSLMVLMVTVNTAAGVAGQIYGRVKHYKRLPMVSLVIAVGAVIALALSAENLTPFTFQLLLAVIGFGFGPVPPICLIALQNTVQPHQFGIAVGTMNFSRTLYGTILIAIFGAVVMAGIPAGEPMAPQPSLGEAVDGFRRVFFGTAASLAIAFVCLVLMEEKPLRTNRPAEDSNKVASN